MTILDQSTPFARVKQAVLDDSSGKLYCVWKRRPYTDPQIYVVFLSKITQKSIPEDRVGGFWAVARQVHPLIPGMAYNDECAFHEDEDTFFPNYWLAYGYYLQLMEKIKAEA